MRSVQHHQHPRSVEIFKKNAGSTESDDGYLESNKIYQQVIGYLKKLLAYPLALLLISIAFVFRLFKRENSRQAPNLMSRQWPKLSRFKSHIQSLFRSLWRNSQPKRQSR